MGHRTRGNNKWTDTSIDRSIADWTAKGVYRINVWRKKKGSLDAEVKDESEWGMVQCEPAVSESLWNEANQLLEERRSDRKKRPGSRPTHLFGGVVYCHCGQKMYVGPNTPKYVCVKCRNKIPMVDLESIFVAELKEVFSNKTRIAEQVAEGERRLRDKKQLISAHNQEIGRVREEMTKTHRLYLDGQIALSDFGNSWPTWV